MSDVTHVTPEVSVYKAVGWAVAWAAGLFLVRAYK